MKAAYIQVLIVAIVVCILSACTSEKMPVVHLNGPTMGTTYNIKYVVENEDAIDDLQRKVDCGREEFCGVVAEVAKLAWSCGQKKLRKKDPKQAL